MIKQLQSDTIFYISLYKHFFAARYLVTMLETDDPQPAVDIIKSKKYNSNFSLLFIFSAGLLTSKQRNRTLDVEESSVNIRGPYHAVKPDPNRRFWNYLDSEPRDLVGFRYTMRLMEYIDEHRTFPSIMKHGSIIGSNFVLLKFLLSLLNIYKGLSVSYTICLSKLSFNVNSLIYTNQMTSTKCRNVTAILSSMQLSDPLQEYVEILLEAINTTNA